MKLTEKQASQLNRLLEACGNAKSFSESGARQERLDSYIEKLVKQGVSIQDILNAVS